MTLITSIPFLCLIKRLCDAVGVLALLGIDNPDEVT